MFTAPPVWRHSSATPALLTVTEEGARSGGAPVLRRAGSSGNAARDPLSLCRQQEGAKHVSTLQRDMVTTSAVPTSEPDTD